MFNFALITAKVLFSKMTKLHLKLSQINSSQRHNLEKITNQRWSYSLAILINLKIQKFSEVLKAYKDTLRNFPVISYESVLAEAMTDIILLLEKVYGIVTWFILEFFIFFYGPYRTWLLHTWFWSYYWHWACSFFRWLFEM